ncbi:MAG: hypothetical protein M1833_007084 [Piccolia ochrophora]|nr:MAG: hypothetical protein M1833_007084 [Piccolia ochrophora]
MSLLLFNSRATPLATANAEQSIQYGTKIVGGVTPGKAGEHLKLPVLPTVLEAKEQLRPDATAVFVAAHQAGKAIEEAIEAEIPLVVAVAEHVPIHDMIRIHSILKTQSCSRLVGANCPGIISPIGHCRIGFQPLPCFSAGRIGIVAKSGTLSYETVASTTRAGVGQSLVIGMGGDVLAGTNLVDALRVFEEHEETEGIIVVGEIGGTAEEDAAEWIKDYRRRTSHPKPIVALVAGFEAAPGRVMGHAGAFVAPGESDAVVKAKALTDAGVEVIRHPSQFGSRMKSLLETNPRPTSKSNTAFKDGRRPFSSLVSTISSRPLVHGMPLYTTLRGTSLSAQRRNFYLEGNHAVNLLKESDVCIDPSTAAVGTLIRIAVSVDRSTLQPRVVIDAGGDKPDFLRSFPFDYRQGLKEDTLTSITQQLQQDLEIRVARKQLATFLLALIRIFTSKEAFLVQTHVAISKSGEIAVRKARFGFDDAAFKIGKRHEEVHRLRNMNDEVPQEVEAEADGIVYVKLPGDGKIVNGAGLAMNTNDALRAVGGHSANFLDTGGKATSETVRTSFRLILQDRRVKAIFVNIFGGLTRCDMIAQGIMLAFEELDMQLPVVVRLRGTNEESGQRMIAQSGLPLLVFDDFDEAAKKVIELANQ